MAFEDLGLARLIPNAFVYEASDAAMLKFLIKKAAAEYGIHYISQIFKGHMGSAVMFSRNSRI